METDEQHTIAPGGGGGGSATDAAKMVSLCRPRRQDRREG